MSAQEKKTSSPFPFEKAAAFGTASWVKPVREKAWARFQETGFPSSKIEAWKQTSLEGLLKNTFSWGKTEQPKTGALDRLKSLSFDTENADVVVFLNGFFMKKLSKIGPSPKGVVLGGLLEADEDLVERAFGKVLNEEGRAFAALNTAYFTDGLFISVPEGKTLSKPLHVVYLTTHGTQACQSHVRNLILLGRDSQASVIEHYLGENDSPYFVGSITEAALSSGASLEHTKIQQENDKAYHLGALCVRQEEGSRLVSRHFSLGGALARHEVETVLAAPRAECVMEGLYLPKGHQHMDNRTFIDHAAPSCKSDQTFKGVLDGEAVGVFDGRILVRENSQKTDARQTNKNLQLSRESKVYSKPQLQIYADDVKCSHGSATGQMDEEALFYFQSRGVGREEAKRTLVYAFAGEMVERISSDYLKVPLRAMVQEWMTAGRNS